MVALAFVLPACALVGLFVYWPALSMAHASLHHRQLTDRGSGTYCGLDNYRSLWADPDFRQSACNTAWFTLLVVPAQCGLALLLAVWTNGPGWSRRALRLAVFVPTTISLTVLAVLWKLMYEPATATGAGLINGLLISAGLVDQPFLTSPGQAMFCIAVMSVWQGAGFQMMIFLAGLQTVPQELYEAASIDGARRWQRFRHVTLPGIAPTLALVIMITTIFALKLFVQPHLMTKGGPQGATRSIVQYIYEVFRTHELGMACAAGAVFFVVVTAIAGLERRWLRAYPTVEARQ